MRAGTLRHTITLQRPREQREKDEFGETLPRFIDVDTVAAWVQPQSGEERFVLGQWIAGITHIVTLRFEPVLDAMTAAWRVIWKVTPEATSWKTLVLAAPPLDIDGKHREFELHCLEGERQS